MFIDLTLPIDERTPVFPGNPQPKITQISRIAENGWNEKQLTFTSHFSTHIDAPRHMIESGKALSDYPISSFIGEAVLFDVQGQAEIKVDTSEVKENDMVFFFTGYINHIYDKDYFLNNPVLSKHTVKQLIEKKISIIGIDSFTPDNEPFHLHKELFKRDILIVENMVHLEKIKKKRFLCYIFPLNIKDADGAPCRIVAEI